MVTDMSKLIKICILLICLIVVSFFHSLAWGVLIDKGFHHFPPYPSFLHDYLRDFLNNVVAANSPVGYDFRDVEDHTLFVASIFYVLIYTVIGYCAYKYFKRPK